MAAPMREGAPAGGTRPAPHAHPANFEYDDNEWDIGIGDLIIDLDADIEKTDEAGGMAARAEPDAQRTALKMKIKRTKPGTKSSEAKHEIVKSNETNGEPKPQAPTTAVPPAAAKRGSGGHRRDKARDKHHHPHPPHDVNGVARVPPPPNAPGPPAAPSPASLPAGSTTTPTVPKPEQRPAAAPRLEAKPMAPTPSPQSAATAPAPPPAPAPPAHLPHPPPPSKPEPDDSRQENQNIQPPAKKQKTEPKNYELELRFTESRSRCQRQSVRNAKQSRDQSDNDDAVQTRHTIATAATIIQENASGLNSVAIGIGGSSSYL